MLRRRRSSTVLWRIGGAGFIFVRGGGFEGLIEMRGGGGGFLGRVVDREVVFIL